MRVEPDDLRQVLEEGLYTAIGFAIAGALLARQRLAGRPGGEARGGGRSGRDLWSCLFAPFGPPRG